MSCLAGEFDIIIDRLVDSPGYGKDVVDGMNAQDKVYLRHKMIVPYILTRKVIVKRVK